MQSDLGQSYQLSVQESEEKLEKEPRVMVHILLNERDWKVGISKHIFLCVMFVITCQR